MMPKNDIDDKSLTPKQFAIEMVRRHLEGVYYWKEHIHEEEAMTDHEKDLIDKQIEKLVQRINRILGPRIYYSG